MSEEIKALLERKQVDDPFKKAQPILAEAFKAGGDLRHSLEAFHGIVPVCRGDDDGR